MPSLTRLQLTVRFGLGLVTVAVAGCGGDNNPIDQPDAAVVGCTEPIATRLLPLKIGAHWTYATSKPGVPVQQKANSVEAYEDVGDRKAGIMAFRIKTELLDKTSVSWQQDLCTSVIRHREKTYDLNNVLTGDTFYLPSKLRLDETPAHVATGAAWTLSLTEIMVDPVTGVATTVSKDENWSVVAASESITVPAGTFAAIHLNKKTSGNADKDYWYAAGVGKLKETGDQTEELTAYTIP